MTRALVLVLVAACGHAATPVAATIAPKPPTGHPSAAGPSTAGPSASAPTAAASGEPAAAWVDVQPDGGGYRISYPSQPSASTQSIDTDVGPVLAHFELLALPDGHTAYLAGYNDYPASADVGHPDALLDGARDGALANVKATLEREQPIHLGGHPGREFTAAIHDDLKVRARIFVVGHRLFQCILLGQPDFVAGAEATRFLDSFALVD